MFGLFGSQGLIEKLLDGNGKAKKLREAEAAARTASWRMQTVIEEAAMRTAKLTENAAEMALDDDDSIDIEEVRAEVDREIACHKRCAECDDDECDARPEDE